MIFFIFWRDQAVKFCLLMYEKNKICGLWEIGIQTFKYNCFFISLVGPPGQPKGPLKVKPLTKDSVTLDWKPPTTDGGSPITSYSIEKREGTRHTWFHVATTRGSVTDYTVTGLTEGRDYAFRVYAENRYGRSQPLESDLMVAPKKVQGNNSVVFFFSML